MSQEHADTVESIYGIWAHFSSGGGRVTPYAWALALPEGITAEQAWDSCPQAGWLLCIMAECSHATQCQGGLALAKRTRAFLSTFKGGYDRDACERYLASVERCITAPSDNAREVLYQDRCVLWALTDTATKNLSALYAMVALIDTRDNDDADLYVIAELIGEGTVSDARTADAVREALPWSVVAADVLTFLADAKKKGPGA